METCKLALVSIFCITATACGSSCSDLPTEFTSYDEAISMVRTARYALTEHQKTDRSSWVTGAEYYSCDGVEGYFILRTSEVDYLHMGVPLKVWQEFKTASSFGTFYSQRIRGSYRMHLGQ